MCFWQWMKYRSVERAWRQTSFLTYKVDSLIMRLLRELNQIHVSRIALDTEKGTQQMSPPLPLPSVLWR